MSLDLAVETPKIAIEGSELNKGSRTFELALVLFVALSQPLLNSSYVFIYGSKNSATYSNFHYLFMIVHEVGSLLLLWYVLSRSGRTFSSLGLRISFRGFLSGLGLVAGAFVVYFFAWYLVQFVHKLFFGAYLAVHSPSFSFPRASWALVVPMLLLNPLFEELIVRGYLMTELRERTGSTFLAVAASALVQASYHLYQGLPAATCLLAGFLVLSTYYARTKNLFPPVIAHLAADLRLLSLIR
jgi:uncharacterized protein